MKILERYRSPEHTRTQIQVAPKRYSDEAKHHIFFLGGAGINQYGLRDASGYLKGVETILGGAKEAEAAGIKMSCVVYNKLPDDIDFQGHYKKPETFYSSEAERFVDYTLKMVLSHEDEYNPFDPTQVTPEELAKRANKITFVGHSYGGVFSQEVCNVLKKRLRANGYTEEQLSEVIGSFVSLNIANTARLDTQEAAFQRYTFCMKNDEYGKGFARQIAERMSHCKNSPSCSAESMLRKCGYLEGYDNIKIMPVDTAWRSYTVVADVPLVVDVPPNAPKDVIDKLYHSYPNHVMRNDERLGYSDIIQRVLLNAIERGPEHKAHPQAMLLKEPTFLGKQEENVYEGSRGRTNEIVTEKVQEAMKRTLSRADTVLAERAASSSAISR